MPNGLIPGGPEGPGMAPGAMPGGPPMPPGGGEVPAVVRECSAAACSKNRDRKCTLPTISVGADGACMQFDGKKELPVPGRPFGLAERGPKTPPPPPATQATRAPRGVV